jgi:hypothetical protein
MQELYKEYEKETYEPSKADFLRWLGYKHEGKFFYAYPNYTLLSGKLKAKQKPLHELRKFKKLFKNCKIEQFDQFAIIRG